MRTSLTTLNFNIFIKKGTDVNFIVLGKKNEKSKLCNIFKLMRNCKLLILWKLWQNNVLKNLAKCYPKCILMENSLHSLTARNLLVNSFIDFRISTRFAAHSFQTDFIFEIISSSLIPEVIIQRIAVCWFWRPLIFFDVTSRHGFFQ